MSLRGGYSPRGAAPEPPPGAKPKARRTRTLRSESSTEEEKPKTTPIKRSTSAKALVRKPPSSNTASPKVLASASSSTSSLSSRPPPPSRSAPTKDADKPRPSSFPSRPPPPAAKSSSVSKARQKATSLASSSPQRHSAPPRSQSALASATTSSSSLSFTSSTSSSAVRRTVSACTASSKPTTPRGGKPALPRKKSLGPMAGAGFRLTSAETAKPSWPPPSANSTSNSTASLDAEARRREAEEVVKRAALKKEQGAKERDAIRAASKDRIAQVEAEKRAQAAREKAAKAAQEKAAREKRQAEDKAARAAEKERQLKDKERALKEKERALKERAKETEKERQFREKERKLKDKERKLNAQEREQEREQERLLQEKQRKLQEKERKLLEIEREKEREEKVAKSREREKEKEKERQLKDKERQLKEKERALKEREAKLAAEQKAQEAERLAEEKAAAKAERKAKAEAEKESAKAKKEAKAAAKASKKRDDTGAAAGGDDDEAVATDAAAKTSTSSSTELPKTGTASAAKALLFAKLHSQLSEEGPPSPGADSSFRKASSNGSEGTPKKRPSLFRRSSAPRLSTMGDDSDTKQLKKKSHLSTSSTSSLISAPDLERKWSAGSADAEVFANRSSIADIKNALQRHSSGDLERALTPPTFRKSVGNTRSLPSAGESSSDEPPASFFEGDPEPVELFGKLKNLAEHLQDQLELKDHKSFMKRHKNCLAAKDMASHLVSQHLACDEADAHAVCAKLLECGIMTHADSGSKTYDKGGFYRWQPATSWHRHDQEPVISVQDTSPERKGSTSSTAGRIDQVPEPGVHLFKVKTSFSRKATCAVCSKKVWSLLGHQSQRCRWCKIVVHEKCVASVEPCTGVRRKRSNKKKHDDGSGNSDMSEGYSSEEWTEDDISDSESISGHPAISYPSSDAIYEEVDIPGMRQEPATSASATVPLLEVEPPAGTAQALIKRFSQSNMEVKVSKTKEGYDDDDIYDSVASVLKRSSTATEEEVYEDLPDEPSAKRDNVAPALGDTGKPSQHSLKDVRLVLSNRIDTSTDLTPGLQPIQEGQTSEGQTSEGQISAPSVNRTDDRVLRKKHVLWRQRTDVIDAGLLDSLSKQDLSRQEAIHEITTSEESYLNDLESLLRVYLLPLEAHRRSCEFSNTTPLLAPEKIKRMHDTAVALKSVGRAFLKDLKERQEENMVVPSVADIFLRWAPDLKAAFFAFCEMAMEARADLDCKTPELSKFLEGMVEDKFTRGLPIDAFLLAPIQRCARYPLLIRAVASKTEEGTAEHVETMAAFSAMEDAVHACNEQMRQVEDYNELVQIDGTLDYSRIDDPTPLVCHGRSVVRRGPLDLVTVSNGKIAKSKRVEVFLFTDLFMYAKPCAVKKGGKQTATRYIVYKQVHRSLLEATDVPDLSAKNEKEQNLLQVMLLQDNPDETQALTVRAESATDKRRWMDCLTPPKSTDAEEIYASWDCPQAEALYDYDGKQADELTLRAGDIINIVTRATDGWWKGSLADAEHKPGETVFAGWFPETYVKEIPSMHSKAKKLKEQFHLRDGDHDATSSA
eukprot:m.185975 g.185975  ORF g.185975 m.185975 type:complete len:1558 (-) comp18127_c0_seq4:115-4788(-)